MQNLNKCPHLFHMDAESSHDWRRVILNRLGPGRVVYEPIRLAFVFEVFVLGLNLASAARIQSHGRSQCLTVPPVVNVNLSPIVLTSKYHVSADSGQAILCSSGVVAKILILKNMVIFQLCACAQVARDHIWVTCKLLGKLR